MITIENVAVWGWETAIRGMRNPMNSWDKSDSEHKNGNFTIGQNDYKLMMNLCKGGTEESKWRRMIHVSCDITAPIYWIAEHDTYKVGTTRNSCSFMHRGTAKPFEINDFSYADERAKANIEIVIDILNALREEYLETKDQKVFQSIRQLLPSGYNQRYTWDANYEVLAAQYRQRKNHRLPEWRTYCEWIRSLPYSEFITGAE